MGIPSRLDWKGHTCLLSAQLSVGQLKPGMESQELSLLSSKGRNKQKSKCWEEHVVAIFRKYSLPH